MNDHQHGMQTRDVAILLDVSETTVLKYANALEAVRDVAIARDNVQRKYSIEEVALLCAARQRVASEPRLSIKDAIEAVIDQCNDPMFAGQVLASLRTAVWIESRLQNWQVEMNEISANHALHFSQIEIKYDSISDFTDRLSAQGTQLQGTFDKIRGDLNSMHDEQRKLLDQTNATVESGDVLLSFAMKCFIFFALVSAVVLGLTIFQFQKVQDLVEKIPHPIVRIKK
jgi:hypothetical protein